MELEKLKRTVNNIKSVHDHMELEKLRMTINDIKSIHGQKEKAYDDYVSIDKLEAVIDDLKIAYKDTRLEKELEDIIGSIKSTYIHNWKDENKDFVNRVIDNLSPDRGLPTPVLSVCGKGTREIRFTRYLAYYLDPCNSHGLGDKLLQNILDKESEEAGLSKKWYQNCSVESEYYLGDIETENGNVASIADIVINGDDFVIIIEHKILASESEHPEVDIGQLERYSKVIKKNDKFKGKDKLKILLEPSPGDENKYDDWMQLSHEEVVNRGVKLLKNNSLSTVARENLTRLLIDLAVGPYEVMLEDLESIYSLGKSLINEKFNVRRAVKFDRLISEHEQIIEIILEG